MDTELRRRDFLRLGASVGAGLAIGSISMPGCANRLAGKPKQIKAMPIDLVRIGIVGIGARGSGLLKNFLDIEGAEIRAVCDIKEDRVAKAQQWVTEKGQAEPTGYSRGETDFKRMCQREDLDLVVTATPWEWHTPVCVAAMKAGKHAATEVPAAVTVDECWKLVETSEKTNRHCVMLENVCYFQNVMMVFNMLRQGVFGELVHCEAGYQHNRSKRHFDSKGNLYWRTKHYVKRDGNPYPTHPIGPIAHWMDINRGDRFDYLVSMSTSSKALNIYAAEHFGADHRLAKMKFALGDINTTLIRTVKGRTVTLYHDTQLPRPYNLIFRVQGTKGIYLGTKEKIYIEGRSPKSPHETWEPIEDYADEYEHPLWKALGQKAKDFGHGGCDYMELYRLVKVLREGAYPDMDVYDAATWSCISGLTERSVAYKSRPVDFPDFTRGMWKTNPPIGIFEA